MPIIEPPRIVSLLIRLLTPPGWREDVDECLRDGYSTRCDRIGPRRAHLWCWRQLVSPDVLRLWFNKPGAESDSGQQPSAKFGSGIVQDVGFALRAARKAPAFSAVVLTTLALGIGATTAIFSVVNGVLVRPLPYAEPEQLVMVFRSVPRFGFTRSTASYPDFADWRDRSTSFTAMAAYAGATRAYRGKDGAEQWSGYAVTADMMPMLGANAWMGRTMLDEEDRPGGAPVVVLSHRIWQSRFTGDPTLVGQSITLDGEPVTVIGVMAADFDFPTRDADFWVPLKGDRGRMERDSNFLLVIGRMGPGISIDDARVEIEALAAGIDTESPDGNRGFGVYLEGRHAFVIRNARTALLVFFGAVALVLAVACTNVANLMLARGTERRRELALRMALGAGRGRLLRQMLTESTVLALGGGLLGLGVAYGLMRVLLRMDTAAIPRLNEVGLDPFVLAFSLLISIGSGIAFGIAPALFGMRTDPGQSLKGGLQTAGLGRGARRFQEALVVAEVALAMLLAVGAGLLMSSFLRLTSVEPGFDPTSVIAARVPVPRPDIEEDPNLSEEQMMELMISMTRQLVGFQDDLTTRIAALPGVDRAALSYGVPFGTGSFSRFFIPVGMDVPDGDAPVIDGNVVTPDYFQTMRIPVIRGRALQPGDGPGDPSVIVISEAAARRFWPDEDAIGKRVRIGGSDNDPSTVVGLVADVRSRSLDEQSEPFYYRPLAQVGWPDSVYIVARSAIDPVELVPEIRRQVWAIDPTLPLTNVATAGDLIESSVAAPRFRAIILFTFSTLALVLALVGIYGVIAYSVGERSREIGVRMALGAERGTIARMILSKGLGLTMVGVVLGVAGGIAVTRVIEGMLFGVTPYDPATYAGAGLLLLAVALFASYVPARRAAKMDVGLCLRWE